MDRATGRTVAWVLGDRSAATFRQLYAKVQHLKDCMYYTDDWDAFAKVLPGGRHQIGKQHTVAIERDNSNTRHHLGRMTRRTKIVSKKEGMVHVSLKLWCALTIPDIFAHYQDLISRILSYAVILNGLKLK